MNMNETYMTSAASRYAAPQVSVMEIETEGVLCQSGGTGFGSTNESYRPGSDPVDF